MRRSRHPQVWLLGISLLWILTACSTHVSQDKVPGSFVASYPFGNAELTIASDGTFVQTVVIEGQSPATAKGTWVFDASRSEITLHGAMPVTDGFGHLQTNWRQTDDLPDQPVEVLWFRTEIEVNESYPYVKR